MTTMLIANNCTRENGQFMGDQLCYVKAAYLFAATPGVDRVLMSVSPANEMSFVWKKFIDCYNVELVPDDFNPGDNEQRWAAWDRWRRERSIEGIPFDHYRELYLRIHGALRQTLICGSERGLNRRNIYEYIYFGQENLPDSCPDSDWYDDTLVDHPPLRSDFDVYISPECKTQGNRTFTFDFWAAVTRKLIASGISVTVGYDGQFCEDLRGDPLYRKHWGSHEQWFSEVCRHKLVACGNTGTGWVAAACGVPLITMEPHNSCMADHRYRECGLKNIVEVVDGFKLDELNNDMNLVADYVARRITEEVRKCLVLTTGCYDVLHAGHIRHLERAKALGTKLIVALNTDVSVKALKGEGRPINPFDQRKAVLEALRSVDEVVPFDGDNAALIRELKPDVLACGFGYTEATIVGKELVPRTVVTCTGDASAEPSTTKVVAKVSLSDILRAGAALSVNPYDKLKLMAERFLRVSTLQGDVADLGAYKGGTSLILRRLAPDKRLHLFDTWQGNPYDDPLCHHKKGEWPASLEDCVKVVGNGDLTTYWVGVFPYARKSCHDIDITASTFSFVYVDLDTEQATRDAIDFFWPRLVPGGELFFDDYGWTPCAGVKKVVDEAFASITRIEFPAQHSCAVVK